MTANVSPATHQGPNGTASSAVIATSSREIMSELDDDAAEDPEGIPVHLLIGCFVPPEAPG